MEQSIANEYLTPPEAARELSWTRQRVILLINAGKLPAVNVGAGSRPRWLIRREDLREFLTPACKRSSAQVEATQHPEEAASRSRSRSSRRRIDANVAQVF